MNTAAGASIEREHPINRFIAPPRRKKLLQENSLEIYPTTETFGMKRFALPGSATMMAPRRIQHPSAVTDYSKFLSVKSRNIFNNNV
jgi:hypothetical protein